MNSAVADVLALEARHGSTLFEPTLVFERGEGALIYDAQGREYIDCAAGIGVASVGHGNPRLARAIADQAARLLVCPPSQGNRVRAEFDEIVAANFPDTGPVPTRPQK